jgi:hypothetical protein
MQLYTIYMRMWIAIFSVVFYIYFAMLLHDCFKFYVKIFKAIFLARSTL